MPETEEKVPMRDVKVTLPAYMWDTLDRIAEERKITLDELFKIALTEYIEKHKV